MIESRMDRALAAADVGLALVFVSCGISPRLPTFPAPVNPVIPANPANGVITVGQELRDTFKATPRGITVSMSRLC